MKINQQNSKNVVIKIAVIAYPYMSNYNDFEPLIADESIELEFIEANISLDRFDMVILPGSKLVIKDLKWLKNNGLCDRIKEFKKELLGLCGGYEMMFETLNDKYALENDTPIIEEGFGFIKDEIVFEKEKVLKKQNYKIFDCQVSGFEIHHGVSLKYPLYYENRNIKGTFVHAIFDNDSLRERFFKEINKEYRSFDFKAFKTKKTEEFVNSLKKRLDIEKIRKSIDE